MRYKITFLFFFLSFINNAQINEDLTAEERAYLFHVVKKSPILNNNLGRYFEYSGPEINFPDGKMNFDSVEILIINNPEYLIVHKSEIAKSSKGLLAEASNKMAIWELNKVLKAKRTNNKDLQNYQNEYDEFEDTLIKFLPSSALKDKDGELVPISKLNAIINPSLSFNDKRALVESIRSLSIDEKMAVLRSINKAINIYVDVRAEEIYNALGGEAEIFDNVLVAAGDGSNTSGILEEREKDEHGRWNRGLPKAVGLFPYQMRQKEVIENEKPKKIISPMMFTENNFHTSGENKETNIHLDVWGYNAEKQTTVVLEKNGLHYHLFGSGETRFLSPDSTFASGGTFMTIIHEMEGKIKGVEELIYGKKGFDHWIEYNKKKKKATELKIQKREKEYSDLGYTPISTDKKASRRVKKSKKKAIKNNKSNFDGTPTTNANKSEKGKLQDEIVYLYGLFEAYRLKIIELEEQKQAAIDLLAKYKLRLDQYNRAIGLNWAEFEEEDGLYIFEDSSTFDIYTQEFKFPASQTKEKFEIRLVAIPGGALSDQADEVMLHINVTDDVPIFDARIRLELEDEFASDQWDLSKNLLSDEDSVSIMVFFDALLEKKSDLSIITRGSGMGKWNGNRTVRDPNRKELNSYPGTPGFTKLDTTYSRLRKSELFVHINRGVTIEINSYTDPIKSNLNIDNQTFLQAINKYGLTKNDILSAYRTVEILEKFKKECNVLAGKYLSREEAVIVIDKLNKKISKTKISVGRTSFKQSEFN